MSRHIGILLAFALAGAVAPAQGEIFKSVDKDGNVVFTDQPEGNAEPVQVGPTNSMRPPPDTHPPAPTTTPEAEVAPYYESVDITSPPDGSVINNPVGNVLVHYTLTPPLREGDSVRLLVDGVPGGMPAEGGLLAPTNSRGEHRFEVQVLDATGTVIGASAPVRVTVFRSPVRDKPGRPRTH